MTETSTAADSRRKGLILLLVSLLAGFAMAFAVVATIVASNGPKDSVAIVDGKQVTVSADELLTYGG
jgi:hypothetical protein